MVVQDVHLQMPRITESGCGSNLTISNSKLNSVTILINTNHGHMTLNQRCSFRRHMSISAQGKSRKDSSPFYKTTSKTVKYFGGRWCIVIEQQRSTGLDNTTLRGGAINIKAGRGIKRGYIDWGSPRYGCYAFSELKPLCGILCR